MEYTGPFMREESFVDTAKQCPTGLTASFQFTYNVTSESVHLTTLKWFDVQSMFLHLLPTLRPGKLKKGEYFVQGDV